MQPRLTMTCWKGKRGTTIYNLLEGVNDMLDKRTLRRVVSSMPVLWLTAVLVGLLAWLPLEAHAQAPVRFAVIGDYGFAGQAELDVATLVQSWNPDFILTVGDNNYDAGSATTIDANIGQYYHAFISPYTGGYGQGAAVNRFFPSLGNHDWGNIVPNPTGATPYLNYFTLPNNERYYDVVWGAVHVFALDSDMNEPDGTASTSTQGQWLQQALATTSAPWKLVYFHHAPYSSGTHGSTTYMQWPFQAWGATAVLAGHDHTYERIIRNGFPYMVNGLGGRSIYTFGTPVTGSVVRYNGDYGAMLVDASTDTLRLQFITRGGTLVDIYTLYTPAAVPSQLTATPVSNSQIDLAWTDHTTYEAGFRIERSTDGTNFTQVATVGPNVTSYANTGLSGATTYFYRVRAYDNGGASGYSNIGSAATPASVPAAPSNLTATAVSKSQINLTWSDNASNETGFQIERLNGATWSLIATVGPNVTSYANTGLAPSTRYYYRVQARNSLGGSAYSNAASARTKRQ